ncbi:MAG: hypothetical protein WBG95_12290 [Sulfitobacter sp.]
MMMILFSALVAIALTAVAVKALTPQKRPIAVRKEIVRKNP